MAETDRGPTLTDAIGMGGIIAQDGFDYQVWEGLIRLPAWLANPAFEALIFEGLEDIEARFFAPHAPEHHLLERLQAKSGDLGPKEVREIFERFRIFEKHHPSVTRVHTLITPRVPPTLRSVARHTARVRKARPFYAPFEGIRAASDEKLTEDLIKELGDELGSFVASGVEVTERPLPSRETALHAFSAALAASFPATELTQQQVNRAFGALEALATRSRGVALARTDLVQLLDAETRATLAAARSFRVHVRSDRTGEDPGALEIDAGAFSGGPSGFPAADQWRAQLVRPLDATAGWLRRRGVSRVALSGTYRLTTAFLVGHAFRSAAGFELEIATREGTWATDDRPVESASDWSITPPTQLDGDALLVSLGVLRRPSDTLISSGYAAACVLDLHKNTAISGAKQAQADAAHIKAVVLEAATRLKPKRISLYYAGPAAFAVALGHRWNAMLPTNLFEFDATNGIYLRSADLAEFGQVRD